MNKITITLIAVVVLGVVGWMGFSPSPTSQVILDDSLDGEKAIVYKSSSCGCCGLFSDYLRKKSDFDVGVVNIEDMPSIKRRYSIPGQVESCHTTIIGDYFIEGHMPWEAIEKLMTEQPDIAGIALPRMPSGSPGMPGTKNEPWTIYQIAQDGSQSEFMTL